MYSTPWDELYKQTQQRNAYIRQVRAKQAEAQTRVDSQNFHASRAKLVPPEEQQRMFREMARQKEEEAKRQKARAKAEAKERAERNKREFYERLKNYKGPFDPLLMLLGIQSKQPTVKEIRSCYLEAIRKHHPDAGGSEEMAKRINSAYEILLKEFNKK